MRHLIATLCVTSVWLLSQPAIAQDEEPAAPIEKAPYHLPVFKNEYVTVLKIDLPPHRNTGFHIHTTDSVSVSIEEAEMANQLPGEKQTPPQHSKRGQANFTAYSKQGSRTHKASNMGETAFTTFRSCLTTLSPAGSRHRRDPVFSVIRRSWITNACAAGAFCWTPAKPRLHLPRPRPDCASC